MKRVNPTDKIFVPKYLIDDKSQSDFKRGYRDVVSANNEFHYKQFPIRPNIYPKRNFWCNFDKNGKQKWFIELSNGRLVADKDENYFFWLKKYTEKK